MVRSNSMPLAAKKPATISTSARVVTMAETANFHSKRTAM